MKTFAKILSAGAACLLFFCAAWNACAADRDYIENSDFTKTVAITFNGTSATVLNTAGVTVSYGANSSYIAITSTLEGVEYILTGTSTDGYVQITSTYASKVTLNGVSLTTNAGPALSLLSPARNFIVTADGTTNTLSDGTATYTRTGSGTLYTSGPMIFSGRGSLNIAGLKTHAIYGGSYVRALGGDVTVTSAVKDAIHSKTFFQMDQGTLALAATGDGIDGDTGYVVLNGGTINIRSLVDNTAGITCDGSMTINGGAVNLTVNGAQSKGLRSGTDMAINAGSLVLNLAGAVVLSSVTSGTTTYTDPSYCTGIKCGGNLTVAGGGATITHTGTAGRAVNVNGNFTMTGGALDLATSGGISTTYTNSAGTTDYASADCLTTDGTITISGGTVTTLASGDAGNGITADGTLTINGGTFNLTNKGNRSKALNANAALAINGGTFTFTMSGGVTLENVTTTTYNPNYCTAIKCDTNFTASAGTVNITHTGVAGKGISVDGTGTVTGGTFNITTSGNASATFLNASNATDIAAADCFKVDGLLTVTGGTITATSTGTGGDAISGDGAAVIGTTGVTGTPVITAKTSGARILVSGSGNSANYANCKAFSVGGNLTFNNGVYTGTTSTDGGEGLESKANLVINGGTIEINSYDDGINATTSITINGGNIYSYASNNDGIDSNGTLKFTGGLVIASGAAAPEEGFDCDNNNFTIAPTVAGGLTMMGTGGATSTPTASTSTQRTMIYKGPATAGTILQIKNTTSSAIIAVYKLPRAYSGTTGMTMVFSSNLLVAGASYSIISGGTVSGGTEFHGYYTGATVTGTTTTLKTFTIASTAAAGSVTTVQ